ncbi:Sir2 family NAD-dependent protein deacetylase [Lysobacter soli]|uniref:Sir2 family NAD-dependent protein deacetylase n=1 Tax=Lysobacter soli TaxID=453783 RepID=UPI0037CC20CE
MEEIVVFIGAGAECGLKTFRDTAGPWREYDIADVASPEGGGEMRPPPWTPTTNAKSMVSAKPNSAHEAIAKLGSNFDVTVITHNVNDLHERAGSSKLRSVWAKR